MAPYTGDPGTVPGEIFRDVLTRMAATESEAVSAVEEAAGEMATALTLGPIGQRQIERVALEATPPTPSMRLHEMLPALARQRAQQPAPAPRAETRPRPTYERPKPIEVKVDTRMDDVDLKELERKIARILRDEARRYGVIR